MKYPMPDLADSELLSLQKYYGNFIYTKYINDMVLREILQNTGRILRNKNDYADLYSMDINLLKVIPYIWKGRKEIVNLSDREKNVN
jgi:hypothetical protein